MSKRYLSFDQYDGTLTGYEPFIEGRDYFPTPGGLSTTYHHWTGGLGGEGDRNPDVFAGTGDRYVAGEYGSMYTPNAHASVHDRMTGPTTEQTETTTLDGKPYVFNPEKKVEGFESLELVDTEGTGDAVTTESAAPGAKEAASTLVVLFVFLMAYIAFDFWSTSLHSFAKQSLNGGKEIKWQVYIGYAIAMSLVFFAILWATDVPLSRIQSSSLLPPF